jgi:protocatechuate 3,4-dioxygenase beta subunit
MRLLLSVSLLAGCLHAQQGGAAGMVVDQAGKPLPGVHIRLVTGQFGNDDIVQAVYGVDSDAAGQFSIDGLKPGAYTVMARRTGYVPQASKGMHMLVVKPGQHVSDYQIVMAERAMIVGRVVDEYGDPVQNLQIELEPLEPNASQSVLFEPRGGAPTDDRGEFRIRAGPGKYYLKAAEFGGHRGPAEVRTDGTNGAPFLPTYYPSAANTGAASVIQLTAGQDLVGLEIHLLRGSSSAAAHPLTISGVVTGIPADSMPMGGTNVMLLMGDKPGEYHNGRGVGVQPDGTFKFTGMEPGYYRASASYTAGKTPLQSRVRYFHLEAGDETGLVLALAPPEDLAGKLEFLGDAPAGSAEKHTVRLELSGPGSNFGQAGPPAAEVAPDGSFRIAGVPPLKFKPVVEPMPENGYLKEVALDGNARPDEILDFTQGVGGSKLKIAVSRNGGRVSGRVLDKDGEPANGLIMVFLGIDPKEMDEENTVRTSDGKFSFKGLRPGKYRLVALDVAEMTQVYSGDGTNDEHMQRILDAGEQIEVKEGDTISKDIPLLTEMPEKKEPR